MRRKTGQVSQDKPEIRLHRYEHILAVKNGRHAHWLMIWPQPGSGSCRAR
jgi:hypothetical protein